MKKFKYRIYAYTDGNGSTHYAAERVIPWWFNDLLWDFYEERPQRFYSIEDAEDACRKHAHKLRAQGYTIEIAREFET